MQSAQNILSNAVAPIDFRKPNQIVGTVEYVAVEVLVSKIIRSILKMEHRGVWELGWIHLLSIPFLGGAGAPFKNITDHTAHADYQQSLIDGAKGIPAVLLAQYVYQTAYSGFHFPKFSFKDLLITAGSKTLSRPLVYSVLEKLPPTMMDGFLTLDALAKRQAANSNLNFG